MTPTDPVALLIAALADPLADRIAVRLKREQCDELVAFPFGLEARAARALVRARTLPTRKIGRRVYARRSDLLALVDETPARSQPSRPPTVDVAEAARAAYVRPLRVVRRSSR